MNHIVQAGFKKAEEPEIKLPTCTGSLKKQESSGKTSTSALLIMPKPLTVWITTNCGKFFKRWKYQTTWPPPEKSVCRSRSDRTGHGPTDWFQIRKGVHQGCILSSCLFNLYAEYFMRNAGLNKRRRTKEPLDESEREEWKSWLKAQHSENEDHGIQFHHFMANRWGNSGNSLFFFILIK